MMQDDLPKEARQVLDYWFVVLTPEQWWERDDAVDADVRGRFADLYARLAKNVPEQWLSSPLCRLAAVIVLDQVPRNMFRDDPRAYATDRIALKIARDAVASGDDRRVTPEQRTILYMPFQHSEDVAVQAQSVELFGLLGSDEYLDFALKHKQVIDRFGRFPHRNSVLGRESTVEEEAFLKKPGLFW